MAYLHLPTVLNGVVDTPDVSATLCFASWVVYNYNNARDSLILSFEQDGILTISKNGDVSTGHWKYDKEENEFTIFHETRRYSLYLHFLDDETIALYYPRIAEKKNGAWFSLKDAVVEQELEEYLGSCEGRISKLYGHYIYMIADSQQINIPKLSLEWIKQHLENKAVVETIVDEVFKQRWSRYNKTISAIIITLLIFFIVTANYIMNFIDRIVYCEIGAEMIKYFIFPFIALVLYQLYKFVGIKMKERIKKQKRKFRQFLRKLELKSELHIQSIIR